MLKVWETKLPSHILRALDALFPPEVIHAHSSVFTPVVQAFRFYEDGLEALAAPIAAQDTNVTAKVGNTTGNRVVQLRYRIQETGGAAGATTDDYQLQVSKNGGAYANVAAASSNVKAATGSRLTDGSATTNRATDGVTDGSGSFLAGRQEEGDGQIPNFQLTASNYTEFLWAIELIGADLATNDTLDFQVTLNGGAPGMTNSVTPRITVAKVLTSYKDEVAADTPTGYWRLGESSGTTAADSSGNGLDATYQETPTLGATSLLTNTSNPAVNFAISGERADRNVDALLQGGAALSVESWYYMNSGASAGNHASVGMYGSATDKGYWINFNTDGTVSFFISRDGSEQVAANLASAVAGETIYHAVGTYDGSTIRLYLNGALIAVTSLSGTIHTVTTALAFAIGRLGNSSFDPAQGRVDEVAIYQSVLTATRINDHYVAGIQALATEALQRAATPITTRATFTTPTKTLTNTRTPITTRTTFTTPANLLTKAVSPMVVLTTFPQSVGSLARVETATPITIQVTSVAPSALLTWASASLLVRTTMPQSSGDIQGIVRNATPMVVNATSVAPSQLLAWASSPITVRATSVAPSQLLTKAVSPLTVQAAFTQAVYALLRLETATPLTVQAAFTTPATLLTNTRTPLSVLATFTQTTFSLGAQTLVATPLLVPVSLVAPTVSLGITATPLLVIVTSIAPTLDISDLPGSVILMLMSIGGASGMITPIGGAVVIVRTIGDVGSGVRTIGDAGTGIRLIGEAQARMTEF